MPDFESVGALWVDAADLAALGGRDYRADDPARYFPAVASGTLVAHSLDTDAFRGFEETVRVLTGRPGGDSDATRLLRAVEQLRDAYPHSAF